MKRYLLVLSTSLILAACAVTELTAEQEQGIKSSTPKTRSNGMLADTLSILSSVQSDAEIMLINLYYKEGNIILALSKEDAIDLGIPEELYDKYSDEIRQVNESGNVVEE